MKDTGAIHFRNDSPLRMAAEQSAVCDALCIDVFDTLLLPLYSEEELFKRVGGELCPADWTDAGLSNKSFWRLRVEAEKMAKRRNWPGKDGTAALEEIYDEMAKVLANPQKVARMEKDTLARSVYLNPNVLSFLEHCKKQRKRVALVAESPFPEAFLREVLTAEGLDASLYCLLATSSERGLSKCRGRLFRLVLEELGLPPQRVLHIGDSPGEDVWGAQQAGMPVVLYDTPRPSLPQEMERRAYGGTPKGLRALRSLARNSVPDDIAEEHRAMFRLGCDVIGPLYTLFAEWVVDEAQRKGIHKALCFMREGELLSGVIRRAAERRGYPFAVELFYISRRAALLACAERIDVAFLDTEFFAYPMYTIGNIFGNVFLDIGKTVFTGYTDMSVEEAHEQGLLEEIRLYLQSPGILATIRQKAAEQKELLLQYLLEVTGEQKTLTVDIGLSGTMQKGLSRLLAACGRGDYLTHLLLMGKWRLDSLVLQGMDIKTWLMPAGERIDWAEELVYRVVVWESIVLADEGSTIAYEREKGVVMPVKERVSLTESSVGKKKAAWRGIHQFQTYYLRCLSSKEVPWRYETDDLLHILVRFLTAPLHEEAAQVGKLPYSDSMKYSLSEDTVCKQEEIARGEKADDIQAGFLSGKPIAWPEGVKEIRQPHYHLEKYLAGSLSTGQHKYAVGRYYLRHRQDGKRYALYGAGEAGQWMAELAFELLFPLECVADKQERLWGTQLSFRPVLPLKEAVERADILLLSTNNLLIHDEVKAELARLGRSIPIVTRTDMICE